MRFANTVVNDSESKEHGAMIPNYLSNHFESKPILLINRPFCNKNEKVPKQLLKEFKTFTRFLF